MNRNFRHVLVGFFFLIIGLLSVSAQQINWSKDGNAYYRVEKNEVVQYVLPDQTKSVILSSADLTPAGGKPLSIRTFAFSSDQKKIMIYTNTKQVWRLDTQGDYWVYDFTTKKLQQVGTKRPESSLRFAKLSPDGTKVAYVSEFNVYVEDLAQGQETALTTDGNRKLINGTFDWVYEEEFSCRDGFQWSPDGQRIAFLANRCSQDSRLLHD